MKWDTKAAIRIIKDHVWGPTGSVVIHFLVILALLKLVTYQVAQKAPEVEVVVMEPDAADLEELEKEIEKLEDMPEVVDTITPPDVTTLTEQPPDVDTFTSTEPTTDFAALDVQSDIQSPLILKGLMQGRSSGGRAAALRDYGGQWGKYAELAVVKALEWLKRNQGPDGSWGPNKPAMTGLGLLTFLAHGETTSSEKYGPTVEKAIRFLTTAQDPSGGFCKTDTQQGPYAHAIATYGISEAYGLTRIPAVKPVMEKAVQVILNGQQPKG